MKKITQILIATFFICNIATAQSNIYGPEKVMVVGAFNGFVTTPFDADYRTMNYRKLSFTAGSPTDGRGQWVTTINAQPAGGDIMPINMNGGGGQQCSKSLKAKTVRFVRHSVRTALRSCSFDQSEATP